MASERNYTATFSIGAKLLGSFKGVMAQAQARLNHLHASTLRIAAGLRKAALGMAGVLTLFAGLGASHILHGVFEGASEEALAADQRARKLAASLMEINSIRKGGVAMAQHQRDLIFAQNEELAKQQLYGKVLLNTASAQLAVYAIPPKQIVQTTRALTNVLAVSKGVNATQEDAIGLANSFGVAIRRGMGRGLKEYGIILTDTQQKTFKGLKDTQKRYQYLMNIITGPQYQKQAANLMNAPGAAVRKLNDQLKEMSETIGGEVQPAQDEMAKAWSAALPKLQPLAVMGLDRLAHAAAWLARVLTDKVIPAWDDFQKFLDGPLGTALDELKSSWDDLTSSLGPEFVKLFGDLSDKGRDFKGVMGDALINSIHKLGDGFKWMADHKQETVLAIDAITAALVSYKATAFLASLVNPFAAIGLAIGGIILGVGYLHEHLKEIQARKDWFGSLARGLQSLDDWLKPFVENFKTNFVQAWSDLGDNISAIWSNPFIAWIRGGVVDALKGIGDGIKSLGGLLWDYIVSRIQQAKDAWDTLAGAWRAAKSIFTGGPGGVPPPPASAAAATKLAPAQINNIPPPASAAAATKLAPAQINNIPGMATGGIVRGRSLLQVAESGPEAIIPLSGGPRAEGLLNYAARAMGVGSINHKAGDIHVTLSAPITIQGNVGSREVQDIESHLRILFKKGQAESRRTSFESGYA